MRTITTPGKGLARTTHARGYTCATANRRTWEGEVRVSVVRPVLFSPCTNLQTQEVGDIRRAGAGCLLAAGRLKEAQRGPA
jgi:hypothetical protein